MSTWRGKRKDEERASDGETEAHAPPKKTAKRDSSSDDSSDDIVVCEISKNRRVAVRIWNGKVIVDIREFYVKDGKQMPGKKEYVLDSLFGAYYNTLSLVVRNLTINGSVECSSSHVDEIDKVVNETA